MKTYKSPKRPHEARYESDDSSNISTFPGEFNNHLKEQGELALDDTLSQLLGFSTNVDSIPSEAPAKTTASENHKVKRNERVSITEILEEGVMYQLFSASETQKPETVGRNREDKIERSTKHSSVEPGISYHSEYFQSLNRVGENLSKSESNEHSRKIKQIVDEIKKLAATTKELQMEFGHITVASSPAPEAPGKYYTNFFEWLLIMLKQARQKVENSKSWLDALQGKSSKKLGYWGKAKQFGTSFTQNNERNVATSTG